MPQLAVETFPSQLFWLAISFVLLWVLMQVVALPRVGKVVDERKARIDGDLAAAQKLRDEAAAILAEYEQAVAAARVEAQTLVRSALDRINSKSIAREQALNERLVAEAKAAEGRIAEIKAAAMTNIADIVRDVANDAATKLLGTPPEPAKLDRAVAGAVGDLA